MTFRGGLTERTQPGAAALGQARVCVATDVAARGHRPARSGPRHPCGFPARRGGAAAVCACSSKRAPARKCSQAPRACRYSSPSAPRDRRAGRWRPPFRLDNHPSGPGVWAFSAALRPKSRVVALVCYSPRLVSAQRSAGALFKNWRMIASDACVGWSAASPVATTMSHRSVYPMLMATSPSAKPAERS